jgi:hypothetical protein
MCLNFLNFPKLQQIPDYQGKFRKSVVKECVKKERNKYKNATLFSVAKSRRLWQQNIITIHSDLVYFY